MFTRLAAALFLTSFMISSLWAQDEGDVLLEEAPVDVEEVLEEAPVSNSAESQEKPRAIILFLDVIHLKGEGLEINAEASGLEMRKSIKEWAANGIVARRSTSRLGVLNNETAQLRRRQSESIVAGRTLAFVGGREGRPRSQNHYKEESTDILMTMRLVIMNDDELALEGTLEESWFERSEKEPTGEERPPEEETELNLPVKQSRVYNLTTIVSAEEWNVLVVDEAQQETTQMVTVVLIRPVPQ